jgi:hypothetical protein
MQQSLLWELWHSWEDGIGWSGGEFSRIANCYRVFLGVLQLVADNLDHHQARTTEVQSWTVVKIDCGMYSSSSSAVTAERKVHTWVLGQFGLAVGFLHFFSPLNFCRWLGKRIEDLGDAEHHFDCLQSAGS